MAALAVYSFAAGAGTSLVAVRLYVDVGLLAIVLVSIAIGQPFTLPYARQQVDPAYWDHPLFLRTNAIIAGFWAAAFATMAGVEALMLVRPGFPRIIGFGLIALVMVAALAFTGWYPKQVRRAAEAAQAAGEIERARLP